jgi:hypothetical protein
MVLQQETGFGQYVKTLAVQSLTLLVQNAFQDQRGDPSASVASLSLYSITLV